MITQRLEPSARPPETSTSVEEADACVVCPTTVVGQLIATHGVLPTMIRRDYPILRAVGGNAGATGR